jgi:hypothetical protein
VADPVQLTFVPGSLVPAGGRLALWGPDLEDERLARAATELDLPTGEQDRLATVEIRDDGVGPLDVPARMIPVLPAVRRLAAMPPGGDWPAWRRPQASVLAWSVAAKLALELVAAGRLLPTFRVADTPGSGRAHWRVPVPSEPRLARLAAAMPIAAHALRRPHGELTTPDELLLAFLDAVADACAREGRRPELDPRRRGPRRPFQEMWADALGGIDPTVGHLRLPAQDIAEQVEEWAAPLAGRDRQATARLAVRLHAPADDGDGDEGVASSETWRLTYLLQGVGQESAGTGGPTEVEAAAVWDRGAGAIELAGRPVDDPEETLVRGLAIAARLFPPIDRSLSDARPQTLELSATEATTLLHEGVDALTAAGIGVQVPPELRESSNRRLRLRIRIGQSTPGAPRVEGAAPLGLSSITDLHYEIALGDETVTAEEFAEIVARGEPLVRWRGTWVRVDHEEVDRIAELAGSRASLELTEALAAALSGQHHVAELGWVETVADGRLGETIERLRDADAPGDAHIVGIEGELRPYQERGVAWLQRLAELGMGGVLADQMGLGKTVMAIALLTSREQDRPHLVVCPTSVVGNWERELARFAPGVEVIRHHGTDRPASRRAFRPGTVTVTSYALLRRDVGMLEDIDWDVLVFDEAQQIKNPASKGARAARALPARTRVAMTGTPIENRLSELWAIVDVTNPGLMGSQRAFNERFAAPIERWHDEDRGRPAAAARRAVRAASPEVGPRGLRRPAAQAGDPGGVLADARAGERLPGHDRPGVLRRRSRCDGLRATGRILALLTALKQICNHPRQYLRDDGGLDGPVGQARARDRDPRRGGRLGRARAGVHPVPRDGRPARRAPRRPARAARGALPPRRACRWPPVTAWSSGSRRTTPRHRSCSSPCGPAGPAQPDPRDPRHALRPLVESRRSRTRPPTVPTGSGRPVR